MSNIQEKQGGCMCGAVRFTATDIEPAYHACHCAMCRRWGSAPFFGTTVGSIAFEDEANVGRHDSSEWAARGFCKQCGSNLFYYMKPANYYSVSVGAFDDQSDLQLSYEIYIDHKPEGYAIAGDLQAMTEAEVIEKFGG